MAQGLWTQVFPRSMEFRLLCRGWTNNGSFCRPQQCFSCVTFAETVLRPQLESHPRFIFFSIYGYVILHKPAAGLNGEVSGVFSHLFLLAWEWGKRAKGRLLQDTGGSWKRSVGFAEQREASGSSSLCVEKFLPHPSLISASLHLLSGCGSPPSCTSSKYSSSLSIFLGPFCSHSRCLPPVVPCPALFRLWYPSGFVEEPGEESAGAGLSGAIANCCFMSPPQWHGWGCSVCLCPLGGQCPCLHWQRNTGTLHS